MGRRGQTFVKGASLGTQGFKLEQRLAYVRSKMLEHWDDPDVVRVGNNAICKICGNAYWKHDRDPRINLPGFITLCNGHVGKL